MTSRISPENSQRMQQELGFEVALEDLRADDPIRIEDSLYALGNLKDISSLQAQQVLSLAAESAGVWVKATSAQTVIGAIKPLLDVYRLSIETSDEQTKKDEFFVTSSRVLGGIILGDSNSYNTNLSRMIREGHFGDRSLILAGAAARFFAGLKQESDVWGQPEAHAYSVAEILDDLAGIDPIFVKSLQDLLPVRLLLSERELFESHPHAYQILEGSLLATKPEYVELASIYIHNEGNQDIYKARILDRAYGDPVDVFTGMLLAMTSEEMEGTGITDQEIEYVAEDLWLELLEIDRRDPRLRPLRHRFIEKEWYWDRESKSYTILETLSGLGVETDEEGVFFVRYQDAILAALRGSNSWGKYGPGVELTYSRGELNGRLSTIFREIRHELSYLPKGSDAEGFLSSFPDAILLAALQTPLEPKKD